MQTNPLLAAVLFVATLACTAASAQSGRQPVVVPAPPEAAVPGIQLKLLDTVVVTGNVSGPGLWQVYIDDERDLWIMGTVKPLPANIEWDSAPVREIVKQAQEVLWYPGYGVNIQSNIFQQAMLGYGYLQAKKNPDGKTLEQVLDPALYARWAAAKAQYMPRNSSVEKKRPLIAAEELPEAAVKRAGLSSGYSFYKAMKPTMDDAGVRSNYPQFEVKISAAVAKVALTDVRRMSLDDAACMSATLDALATDLPRMITNANAWATGDVHSINFAALAKRDAMCADALMSPEFSKKYGLPNINASIADLWVTQARAALGRNESTVAFVPMEYLTGPNNLPDRLRAIGYTVSSP